MANPNRTVEEFRRRNPFPPREARPVSAFVEWLAEQARAGVRFETIEEAQTEFEQREEK